MLTELWRETIFRN